MIRVGLTGGIASGKSLVAAAFQRLGAYVIDSDSIAREVVEPGHAGWHAVVKEFGQQILTPHGEIDRTKLADKIFSDAHSRQRLNEILHPLILTILKERLEEIGIKDRCAIVVADIPLLIECSLENNFDAIIVVWTTPEIQAKRLMERNGLCREEADKRIKAQLPLNEKRSVALHIIENDQSVAHTEQQVTEIYLKLKQMIAQQEKKEHK